MRGVVLSGLAMVFVAAAPQAAQANLFEFLFGVQQQPAYTYPDTSSSGLRVTVRKSKRAKAAKAAEKASRKVAAKHKAPVKVASMAKPVPADTSAKPRFTAARFDPEARPDWHLQDPTLKRGDILILKSGPVVFEGRSKALHVPSEFTALDKTALLSPARQRDIGMMVSGVWLPKR